MKKATEVKYPHSANLFQFCRRVLDHKFGGIRVIDQDVGQILGFDPADCSHWKKGKKNIRSIQAMKSIAEHLGVDEKLVVDVASGDIEENEAFFEYSGYGVFRIDPKVFESAKKDFYRKHAGDWSKEKEGEFRDFFDIDEPTIDQAVTEIHEKLNFREAPLYLPEIVTTFPDVSLVGTAANDSISEATPVAATKSGNDTVINYIAGAEMRPFMRYRIAKALAGHFLPEGFISGDDEDEYKRHLSDVRSNLFAAKLLAPADLVRKEMGQVNVARDIVSQLAEVFWVSKTFMNRRLKEILESNAAK